MNPHTTTAHTTTYYATALTALLSVGATFGGCMLGPGDGAVMSPSESITLGGYVRDPRVLVDVSYYDEGSGGLRRLATSTSTTAATYVSGVNLYGWELNGPLPDRAWGRGKTGRVARLVAFVAGQPLTTYNYDWAACASAQRYNLVNVNNRCRSLHSPQQFYYTPDYPRTADFAIFDVAYGNGQIRVRVRNGGRHGYVTEVGCHSADGNGQSHPAHDLLAPLDVRDYWLAIPNANSQVQYDCGVRGVDEAGTPEPASALEDNDLLQTAWPIR